MNEIQQIDLLERIREHVLAHWPGAEEHLRRLTDTEAGTSPDREAEALLAVLLKASPVGGASLRRVHRTLVALEEGGDEANAGLSPAQAKKMGAALASLRAIQEEHGSAGAWVQGFDGPGEILGAIRRDLPALKGQERWRFLRAVGAPVVIPDRRRQALLMRLGLLRAPEDNSAGIEEEHLHVAQTLGALLSQPVGAIDFLLGAFSGGEPGAPEGVAICLRRPECPRCAAQVLCEYHRLHGDQRAPPSRPTLKDIPEQERPREKLRDRGPEAMSDAELLAILLGTGGRGGVTAVDLANRALAKFGSLEALARAGGGALAEVPGIGPAKAAQIRAAVELGKRAGGPGLKRGDTWNSSEEIHRALAPQMAGLDHEEFWLLLMDTRLRLIRKVPISRGDLTGATVHPREIFKEAIKESAAAVIAVHNHPSGDPSPSREDREFTRQLAEAGKILDIRLLDHLIIGREGYVSFADRGGL